MIRKFEVLLLVREPLFDSHQIAVVKQIIIILNVTFQCFTLLISLHFSWTKQNKIQSYMHNFTLFSREKEWNLKCFHFFREMKSETNIPFTLFEKWKVKWFFVSLFSRSESEIEIPRDRDREVKFQKKSREFSRNETLAGYWDKTRPVWAYRSIWL